MVQQEALYSDTAIFEDQQSMPSKSTETTGETLGELLKRTRISKGLEIADVSTSTRISEKNLRAIEDNDYADLPAEVFCRGYYISYAKLLNLDPSITLSQYDSEKSVLQKNDPSLHGSSSYDNDYSNMARPNVMPFSCLGMLILSLFAFGGFLCWYFSFNPAAYLSQKIRNEKTSQTQVLQSPEKEFFELHKMLSIPSTSNASEFARQTVPPVSATDNYIIQAKFGETTRVSLAIDDRPVFDTVYQKGETATWSAQERMNITLPGKTSTLLTLNKEAIHLPQTDNATLTVAIPNDFLR